MGKPTAQELEKALTAAKSMREKGQDPDFLAKTLLNHDFRLGYLEEVMHAAERYLRGMSEQEHTHLLRAIEKARQEESRTAASERDELGLG